MAEISHHPVEEQFIFLPKPIQSIHSPLYRVNTSPSLHFKCLNEETCELLYSNSGFLYVTPF